MYFCIVEGHHPERVFCQFGMKQPVPLVVDTSTTLHKISCVLHCRAAYLEGRGAIDILLDSGVALS